MVLATLIMREEGDLCSIVSIDYYIDDDITIDDEIYKSLIIYV